MRAWLGPLLLAFLAVCTVARAHAQPGPLPAQPAPAQPAPTQPLMLPPPPQPIVLPPPPFAVAPPQFAYLAPPPVRPPWPVYVWRVRLELGGSYGTGRAVPSVDGQRIHWTRDYEKPQALEGVFDARLTLQRLFGAWFGLGLQLAYSNWQSDYLDPLHRRNHYVSLILEPELRLPLGTCRRCLKLLFGARVGGALSMSGQYQQASALGETRLGGGPVWGVQSGLELPLAARVSVRISLGYEGALLRHRVSYGRLGSELMEFRFDRPCGSLGFVLGLL